MAIESSGSFAEQIGDGDGDGDGDGGGDCDTGQCSSGGGGGPRSLAKQRYWPGKVFIDPDNANKLVFSLGEMWFNSHWAVTPVGWGDELPHMMVDVPPQLDARGVTQQDYDSMKATINGHFQQDISSEMGCWSP